MASAWGNSWGTEGAANESWGDSWGKYEDILEVSAAAPKQRYQRKLGALKGSTIPKMRLSGPR